MTTSWEYKVITLAKGEGLFASPITKDEEITKMLNREGAQGWDLVSVAKGDLSATKLYFKRPS